MIEQGKASHLADVLSAMRLAGASHLQRRDIADKLFRLSQRVGSWFCVHVYENRLEAIATFATDDDIRAVPIVMFYKEDRHGR